MLKKQTKSRKKKPEAKQTNSGNKQPKQQVKKAKDTKEHKISKHNHYASTLTLFSCHNASQCSLLGESRNTLSKKGKSKNRQSSISMIYKDDKDGGVKEKEKSKVLKDVKKSKKNSSLNPNSKSKKQIIRLSPQKGNVNKKGKLTKQQFYERINIGLFKSKTNSQINFSNNSSVRQNQNQSKLKKMLTIDCSDQYILNQHFSNSRIKNNEKRRYDAAVMIQKIVRGYLTRKVLGEFIQKQEVKLYEISMRIKNSSSRKSGSQEDSIENLSSMKNKLISERNNENKTEKMKRLERFKLSEDIFLRDSQQSSQKKSSSSKKRKNLDVQDIEMSLKISRNQLLAPIDHGTLQEQSSIYGQQHDSLSQYIPFDEKYITVNESHNSSLISDTRVHQSSKNKYKYDHYNEQIQRSKQKQKDEKHMNRDSESYFRQTPALSSNTSKSKADDPIPTDFSQKRVHEFDDEFQSRSKQYYGDGNRKSRKIKSFINCNEPVFENEKLSDFSKKNSIEFHNIKSENKNDDGKTDNLNINKQKQMINILRREEKEKWGQIIEMLSHQIIQQKVKNKDNERFMNMILQFSKRNKQQLQNTSLLSYELPQGLKLPSSYQPQQQRSPYSKVYSSNSKDFLLINKAHKSLPEQEQQKQPNLNETKQQIQEQNKKFNKNEEMPLMCKKVNSLNMLNCHTPRNNGGKISILDKTQQLKSFYIKNYSSYPIQQMIEIREQVLEMKQKQMMNKLNEDLHYNRLSHDEFIQCLSEMQQKIENERDVIRKAKMEIFVGHKATHKLMQDCFKDAWYLGFKIPFSQSLKDFKGNSNHLWVKDLIVDELKSYNFGSGVKKSERSASNVNQKISHNNENESFVEQKESYEYQEDEKSENNLDALQKVVQNQKRKSLSLLFQQQDNSTNKNDGNSQQSLYSQDISYNQGDIEINTLDDKNGYVLDEDLNDEFENSFENKNDNVFKFKKVDADKILKKVNSQPSNHQQSPLLLDPEQQLENDNQVLRKISINQRKKAMNQEQGRSEISPSNKLSQMKPKSEVYKVELTSSQEEDQNNQEVDPEIKQVIEGQIEHLLWEFVSEIYVNTYMRNKMCRGRNKIPTKVSTEQQIEFINCLDQQIPDFSVLKPKINQKMTASRLELLKFMRVNFDEDESESMTEVDERGFDASSQNSDVFQQIGKFEHILSSDLCTQTLNEYLKKDQQQNHEISQNLNKFGDGLSQQIKQQLSSKVSMECYKKILERERILKYNETQKNDLRREIKKIEFHCIFDALNEIIMKRRLKFNGYSGIGLNQLSIITSKQSLQDIHEEKQLRQLMEGSKKELIELVGNEKSSAEKLLMENYEKLCENDSQWIYYTEEALSFALQFVYMLEDEIFFEETALIFKSKRKY